MEKVGRNDPCPCGSGKKFKKCCEEKVLHKKFNAQIIPQGQKIPDADKAAKLSSGFFARIPKPATPPPPKDHPDTTDTPL